MARSLLLRLLVGGAVGAAILTGMYGGAWLFDAWWCRKCARRSARVMREVNQAAARARVIAAIRDAKRERG